jgi:hypothetical protein
MKKKDRLMILSGAGETVISFDIFSNPVIWLSHYGKCHQRAGQNVPGTVPAASILFFSIATFFQCSPSIIIAPHNAQSLTGNFLAKHLVT